MQAASDRVPDSEVIEQESFRLWLDREHDIIRIECRPGARVDLAQAKLSTSATRSLSLGRKVMPFMLIDLANVGAITKEARDYFAKDPTHNSLRSAAAIVAGTPVARVIGNFLIGLNRLAIPARLFSDVESAIVWLTQRRGSSA